MVKAGARGGGEKPNATGRETADKLAAAGTSLSRVREEEREEIWRGQFHSVIQVMLYISENILNF